MLFIRINVLAPSPRKMSIMRMTDSKCSIDMNRPFLSFGLIVDNSMEVVNKFGMMNGQKMLDFDR